jgi:hypothetical protein
MAELVHGPGYGVKERVDGQVASGKKGFHQASLSEFFSNLVWGFRYSVCVDDQCVSRTELNRIHRAIPLLEESQHGRGSHQVLHGSVGAQEQWRVVPTISIAQAATGILVVRKEQRVTVVIRVLAKKGD